MLELRNYQQRSLEALENYLRLSVKMGAKMAFLHQTERPFLSISQLPGLPYVCLRVPTGGGKTLMACYACGIAAKEFLHADQAVCLWLVPSNTIREQTLTALRNRQHPYRQAVESRFSGSISVMDLTEALYVQRVTLFGETCIIVSTLAALRVEDIEGRKVYESAGALEHHFSALPAQLIDNLEKSDNGSIAYSLANVLRLHRPIVIMDEAHNARTPLSFDTLARMNPACIIEFTATPEKTHNPEQGKFASNVLHHVSAAELKSEEMIKLPIRLRTRSAWKEVVGESVRAQQHLEKISFAEEKQTGEYIRPIVLLQAQPRSQTRDTITVDVVKQCLMNDFKVSVEQIAIATGSKREIDDINIFDRSCTIRFIITVQALKEGWDCPFAYILCSVSNTGSATAVEQVLGRVLRLPQARIKKHEELNCSYAFVASQRFLEAARSLKDALLESGFEKFEVDQFVTSGGEEQQGLFSSDSLFAQVEDTISEKPDLSKLSESLLQRVSFDEASGKIAVTGIITEQEKNH